MGAKKFKHQSDNLLNFMDRSDFDFQKKVTKYYRLTIYMRWLIVIFLWLTLGIYGIWGIRHEIQLWLDYFTWSAIYYGLAFNPIPTLCLAICVGMTISVLVRQSRCVIWGLSKKEQYYIEQKVSKIIASGSSHPLHRWLD